MNEKGDKKPRTLNSRTKERKIKAEEKVKNVTKKQSQTINILNYYTCKFDSRAYFEMHI